MEIFLTAAATLVVTVIAGIILDYIKNARPRLIYSVHKALPIDIGNKKIGAYLITVTNSSKKTIKDVSIYVQAQPASIRNGGISSPQGLKYEFSSKEDELELKIPFLNERDEISLTAIAESRFFVPNTPEVAIRSPQQFKLENREDIQHVKPFTTIVVPALLATIAVVIALTSFSSNFIRVDSKDVLVYSATINNLPELAKTIAYASDIHYLNQGDIAYIHASESSDPKEIIKYKNFLLTVVDYGGECMWGGSKANIYYNLGKISLLLSENDEAKVNFSQAIKFDKNFVERLLKYDGTTSSFIYHENLLMP